MKVVLRNDVESCKHLPLQGSGVPLFLGTGTLKLEGRVFTPPFILLEYIPDVISYEDIAERPNASVLALLREAVDRLPELRVLHNHHKRNILFSPSSDPTRAVIIDFGQTTLRKTTSCCWATDALGSSG